MNIIAHRLSFWSALWLLVTGLSEIFPGPRFLPASWSIIYTILPEWLGWLWPGLFILAGILSIIGIRSTRGLIIGFNITSLAYFIWGSISIYGWITNQGGTVPGSAAFYLLSGFTAQLSYEVNKNKRIDEQIVAVQERIDLL